jgi:hypothetical protein
MMSRMPVKAAETLARRAAAKVACSRADGRVSSRAAQPLPMNSLNASETGVVERFALRPDSSAVVSVPSGAVVVEVSVEFAMAPFSHRRGIIP